MLELTANKLVFSFPEIHPDAVLEILLHRTFRIPDDGKKYPLPPSLGLFPVRHVDDFNGKVPEKWVGRGGVMVPLFQSEALWLDFDPKLSRDHGCHYPFAIKVATGKCSAVTGKKWSKKLKEGDYLVAPGQPWLDGYVVEDGCIKQFVAAPLGLGITAEEQITGKAEFGGIQIEVIPMDPERFAARFPKRPPPPPASFLRRSLGGGIMRSKSMGNVRLCSASAKPSAAGATNYSSNEIHVLSEAEARAKRPGMYKDMESRGETTMNFDLSREISEGPADDSFSVELSEVNLDMGLAPGGRMEQQVFKDPWGLEDWSKTAKSRCYIHMCNSIGWSHLTGLPSPTVPLTAAQYAARGYPWFKYYEDGAVSLSGTETTKGLKSVAEMQKLKKIPVLPENQSVNPVKAVVLKKPGQVRDGVWK